VWLVPEGGGAPTVFASGHADVTVSGLFLPSTDDWGDNKGRFLTAGRDTVGGILTGFVHTYDATGARQLFKEIPHAPFSQVLIAPDGFGAIGGKLVLSEVDNGGVVDVISPDGTFLERFVDTSLIKQAFGLAFAPGGFGAVGGKLLVSDPFDTGNIIAVDGSGAATLFTTIGLFAGQTGLRQMAFAPTDFLLDLGIPGDLLMVSVSGSTAGGGTLGDVLAVDSTGTVVASLKVIDDIGAFDPRGMFFTADGSLLVSDASDPVIRGVAADFALGRLANAVPEPSMALLLVIGFAGIASARFKRT